MNKILQFLIKLQNKIRPQNDKLLHFYYGCIYTVIGYILYLLTDNPLLVIIPSVPFALIKEYNDFRGYGKVEFLDFAFTVLPCHFLIWVILR